MFEVQKQSGNIDDNFKRRIVAEIINTGTSAASIARRHNIKASRVYKWKKIYGSEVGFVPVSVTKSTSCTTKPIIQKRDNINIAITLVNGCSIAFEGDYDINDILQLTQGLSS